jgi:hypothetical protein
MLRQVLFILLSLCIGFAAMANCEIPVAASPQPASAAVEECHLSGNAAQKADVQPAGHTHAQDASKFLHGCCMQVMSMVSAPILSPFSPRSEAIAFRPTLRLLSRVTDIYRPPRANA